MFMIEILFGVVLIALAALAILAIVALVRREETLGMRYDLKQLYFYIVSFVSLLIAFFSLLGMTEPVLRLGLKAYYGVPIATVPHHL